MALTEDDNKIREIQQEYLDFLDDEGDQGIYHQKVNDMITDNDVRLIVNINDLRKKKENRAQQMMVNSFEEIASFQKALKEFVASADPIYSKQHNEFYIGLEGSFGSKHLSPRTLTAGHLGSMVCVEGIVTKCSLVRPKVVRSVHYCPATKKTLERTYTDLTSIEAFPTSAAYPTKDEDGNPLETEYGLCIYKDHQTFTIQEMPEKAPAGQLPRSVEIVSDNDLVDRCKPGDRVQAVGMYRCLPGKKNGFTSGLFRTILIVNNVKLMSKEVSTEITADDISKIRKFSKEKRIDVFEKLSRSLAPSICGHEYIKKAMLCMLLGGTEKVLDNGTRIRGDINVLLIGDPSVAKSQLLRYVLHTAPRAVPTTGRGSSGVGLTAAVTTDQDTGDRRLEAGAMVLADRGVVCIDEFDKMSDIDRTAIHEVMEQGRVTIAKAGIHAKLNARCSVLAAANPVYGRYDQYKTPMENIGLQDSLLSRFDLLFIVLDKMDPESDRQISDHVLRMHRYRATNEQDGDVLPMGSTIDVLTTLNTEDQNDGGETPMYEKYDHLLHGGSRKKSDKIVSMQFMRKYVHVARDMKPKLTREAADYISEEYSKLRNHDTSNTDNLARTQPVTARALETLIRLSTAHAKCRLSKAITMEDAEAAVELVHFAYFKKVLQKPKKRGKNIDSDASEDEENEERKKQRKERRKKKTKPQADGAASEEDPYDFESAEDSAEEDPTPSLHQRRHTRGQSQEAMDTEEAATQEAALTVAPERLTKFKKSLLNLFKSEHSQSVTVSDLTKFLSKEHEGDEFARAEIDAALQAMMDENQVMVSDDIVFLI